MEDFIILIELLSDMLQPILLLRIIKKLNIINVSANVQLGRFTLKFNIKR